jgi:hypothetical protein
LNNISSRADVTASFHDTRRLFTTGQRELTNPSSSVSNQETIFLSDNDHDVRVDALRQENHCEPFRTIDVVVEPRVF